MSTGDNRYPFTTRRQVLERLAADPVFVTACVAVIQARHEARGTATGASGWMASHARKAQLLAQRLATGAATAADLTEAARLTARYSKQLAAHFRTEELLKRPELATVAAMFSVVPAVSAVPTESAARGMTEESAAVVVPTPAAAAEPATIPKRKGRPVGSKNKPKTDTKPARRRAR